MDMVVLIWIDWYPYHHARLRALLNARREGLRAAGIELVGRTGVHKGLVFREAADPGVPLTTLLPNADWSPRIQLRSSILLWKELNRLDPSVVFVPGYYTAPGFTAALWGRVKRRRTVLMTESTQFDHPRTGWKEAVKGFGIRSLFSYAICGGKAHARYLQALGFPADRIGTCYDVVDNSYYAQMAQSARELDAQSTPHQPYFLFAGRLSPEKNVAGLITAYKNYRRNGGTWQLVLVGSGPQEQVLRQAADESGFAEDITFAGLKGASELSRYYARAGCFVLPSTREPWGLVVNEAMAAGLPVIVSDRCGCAEDLVIDGANGYVFSPAREGDLESKLMQMETAGDRQRAAMSLRSTRLVASISPDRWAEEVARICRAGDQPNQAELVMSR